MRTWNPKRYYIFRSNPTEKLQNLLLIAIPRFHFALCVYTTPRAPLHHFEPKRWVAAQQTISEFGVFCVYVCVCTREKYPSDMAADGEDGKREREYESNPKTHINGDVFCVREKANAPSIQTQFVVVAILCICSTYWQCALRCRWRPITI